MADFNVKVKEYPAQRMAAIRVKTTLNKVPEKVGQLLQETSVYLASQGIEPKGHGFAVYYEVGNVVVDVEAGFVVEADVEGNERVHTGTLPAIKAASTVYEGPHLQMPDAHRAVHRWMHENDVKASGEPAREVFLVDMRGAANDAVTKAESAFPAIVETRAERRRKAKSAS
ncbi:MAG: GyrI-like domain-containing protein [Chloroflexota bacterium]